MLHPPPRTGGGAARKPVQDSARRESEDYQEENGILKTIHDFVPGQQASYTKTFTDEDVQHFVAIAGDVNPLHVDDAFAASTRFGRRVLHGMLTASLFSTMVGMFIPGTGAIYRSQTLTFLRPVHVGETVTAYFEIRTVDRAKHRLTIDAWIETSRGERVVEGVCEAGLLHVR